MDVPPPPASGLRLQEVGDRLFVYFRPVRSWGAIAFLTAWLTLWTLGGVVAALHLRETNPGDTAFTLLWLCFWVVGESVAVGVIAWQLFGHASLAVGREELQFREQIGPLAATNRYDVALVRGVKAARVPHDEDEKPRRDFGLEMSYDGETLHIGEGMGEREAEYIASVVMSRLRWRSWWGDEERAWPRTEPERASRPTVSVSVGHFQIGRPTGKRIRLVVGALVACIVIGGASLVAVFGRHTSPHRTRAAAPSRGPTLSPGPMPYAGPMPSPRDYANAPDYAAAMTSWVLSSGPLTLVSRPRCDAHATWTHWSCTVRAGATPPAEVAGPASLYRCESKRLGDFSCGLVMPLPSPPHEGS